MSSRSTLGDCELDDVPVRCSAGRRDGCDRTRFSRRRHVLRTRTRSSAGIALHMLALPLVGHALGHAASRVLRCAALRSLLVLRLGWAWRTRSRASRTICRQRSKASDLQCRGYVASIARRRATAIVQFDVRRDRAHAAECRARMRLAWYRAPRTPAAGRALAARRAAEASQRLRESGRLRLRRPSVSRGHRRDAATCATTRATGVSATARCAIAYCARARGIAQRIARRCRRSPDARRAAGPRGRRHAGDDARAVARVRGDRHDASDGDLGAAHQHGRGARRVARWRDRRAGAARSAGAGPRCTAQVLAGAGAALGYSLLAGLSVPTQRTLIMLCMYFAARWLRGASWRSAMRSGSR